MHM
ncbi:hypothetical protein VN97_g13145, partial [Penicillium thymicola]|jgi:hypothetical protein